MNREKIKSSELVIIKKILAWQVAQTLGFGSEEELKGHALLLAVDYEDDTFFPLMLGEGFSRFIEFGDHPWSETYAAIVSNAYQKDHQAAALAFFSKDEARRKWKERVEFDSDNFVSLVHEEPKWTHCVQHLFLRDGHLQAVFWFCEIDHFRKSQNAMEFMAEHDALTGLYNRHQLTETLKEHGLDQGPRDDAFFIYIDFDDFKGINDTYGHACGDRALIALAKHLNRVFFHKTNDIVFRLGGDEFLVICVDIDEETLLPYIEKANLPIRVKLDDSTFIEIHTSIGYAHDIEKADEALYYVKTHGKHGIHRG